MDKPNIQTTISDPNEVSGERTKSVGRSNCTVFLDNPDLLRGWDLRPLDLPQNFETPAFQRRQKRVGL